jgi:hypothetical protein
MAGWASNSNYYGDMAVTYINNAITAEGLQVVDNICTAVHRKVVTLLSGIHFTMLIMESYQGVFGRKAQISKSRRPYSTL